MNLIYMARPIYGGWVTFTAHLHLKYNCLLFKPSKRNETRLRDFGYGVSYQNQTIQSIQEKENLVITAIDKHYYEYLPFFPDNTILILHDPTELKGKDNPIINHLQRFQIRVIRKTMQDFLKQTYSIDSEYYPHPFYEYSMVPVPGFSYPYVSISRIDFDKHTNLLLKANAKLPESEPKIQLFGAENRLYVHHKLKPLGFEGVWHGKYPKTLPLQKENTSILKDAKYVLDMSIIKGDGGGTQYTFLEAIYENCVLILHYDWVSQGNTFQDKVNCYVVGKPSPEKPKPTEDEISDEIVEILTKQDQNEYETILKKSKQILNTHTQVTWFENK
jgi:hypothetical protein